MKVLLLGPPHSVVESIVRGSGDQLVQTEEPVAANDPLLEGVDFIISYGYRHLIPAAVLEPFACRAVNLHISLLPWNRGADPNLWSYLEDTPKGVTIHVLDVGLDTGPILAQRAVKGAHDDTLRSSYQRLKDAIVDLLKDEWPRLRVCACEPKAQQGPSTTHRSADKRPYTYLLTAGWDTPVSTLVARASHGPASERR